MDNGWMTEEQIREKFAEIVAQSLHIDAQQVSPDIYLDDLGAESLDLIEISMEVESQFKVWLPEKSILQTAMEVYGPGVLETDGYLTAEGKTLLQRRVPEEDAAQFQGMVSLKDVQRYFMLVGTWIRMIDGLLAYTPTVCAQCGAPMTSSLGFRLKCTACGEEVTLRSGDEINREWVQDFSRNQYRYEAEAQASRRSDPKPAAV
jgi:acyl carrier protein